MATYAIGDIQGCYRELLELLELIAFDPAHDRLWLTGDLVNRGPDSLATLRHVRDLGDRAITVLGNHDLHLLAIDANGEKPKRKDTLDEILAAPERDELLAWLRRQPLLHVDENAGFALVHAGLAPQWTIPQALELASEVSQVLCSDAYPEYFHHMYGDEPRRWRQGLKGWARLRCITNYLTRMRFCNAQGEIALQAKGAPGSQPPGYSPWYALPGRRNRDLTILFGHWSQLPLDDPLALENGVRPLDSGCLWGGRLTALRLEDQRYFSVRSHTNRLH